MVYLWICTGSARIRIAALFTKRTAIFAKHATIRQNVPYFHGKSAAILGKASKCGKLGVMSTAQVRRANQCRDGTFVAFFLTRTVNCLCVSELILVELHYDMGL